MSGRRRGARMTFGEHVDLGESLKEVHEALTSATVRIGRAYTVADANRARRVDLALNELRCWLDDRLYAEHPADATPGVYYGTSRRREEAQA